MATQWYREPWRKLYTKLDARWLGLSVSARGLADELIKYADADGVLFEVDSPETASSEIARRLSAKPREHRRIADDTAELLRDTYLVIAGGRLLIRNFRDAQERLSPDMRRQRAKRERDKGRDASRDESASASSDMSRDDSRESNRIESNRSEKDQRDNGHARAYVRQPNDILDYERLHVDWDRIMRTSRATGSLVGFCVNCVDAAKAMTPPMDPNDYAALHMAEFVAWVDGIDEARMRPAKDIPALDKHFARIQERLLKKGAPKSARSEKPDNPSKIGDDE